MKEGPKGDQGASLAVEAIAGFTSGVLQTFVGQPFDVVKTRLQIHERKGGSQAPLTTMAVFKQLWQSERPVAAFYRAITPNVIGNSVSWSAFFALKAYTEKSIISARTQSGSSSPNASPSKDNLAWYDHGMASIVAGFGTQALTNPIWVVKTRMLAADPSVHKKYRTTWDTISTVYRKEGFKAFYSGFWISTTGVLQGGIQFAMYDELKKRYRNGSFGVVDAKRGDGREVEIPQGWTVAFSTVAKVGSVAVVYPYQVIRSRLQVDGAQTRFGKGVKGVAAQLYKEAGFRGFWRGLVPAVGRTLPATCVTFVVYEWLKPQLSQRLDDNSGERREP